LAATVILTVPFPLPLAPDAMVRNEALLAAVHPQLASAVTATFTVAPPLLAFAFVVSSLTEHPFGAVTAAADCVKITAVPLTRMLAERAAPVFAAML
jgi:hypothetical protein